MHSVLIKLRLLPMEMPLRTSPQDIAQSGSAAYIAPMLCTTRANNEPW